MEKFVILTTQRTGSTLLVRSLDQHKDILLSGEIFLIGDGIHHSENQFPFITLKSLPKRVNYALNFPLLALKYKSFIKEYYREAEEAGLKAAGFKLMLSQLKFLPGVIDFLKKEKIKPLVLTREDVTAQAFSALLAKTTGKYHRAKDDKSGQGQKIRLNPDVVLLKIKQAQQSMEELNYLSRKFNNSLLIDYGDFNNWDNIIKRICNYLDVNYAEVEQALDKMNTAKHYPQTIANYDQLKECLQKEGYRI